MQKLLFILAILLSVTVLSHAKNPQTEFSPKNQETQSTIYTFKVSRTGVNAYEFKDLGMDRWIIHTKYCHAQVSWDDALLYYSPHGTDNKIIFSNGDVCIVDYLEQRPGSD